MSQSPSPADRSDGPETREHLRLFARGPSEESFAEQVHDALAHLNDPVYLQTHSLTRFVLSDLNARPSSLGRALRQGLLDAVESLRPGRDVIPGSHALRRYQVLKLRFVEGLEIPQVLDRLSLSRSVYFVEQQGALKAIASLLFETWVSKEPIGSHAESSGGFDLTERGRADRPKPSPSRRDNLPLQLTSFVGREREIAEVKGILGSTRLLTLTGTGGCGKSRLALQCAADLLDAYPDGVWLVELAPLTDPDLIPQALAFAVGMRTPTQSAVAFSVAGGPERSVLESLDDFVRAKTLLLIIDNCEHMVEECARVVDHLLRASARLRILATSREVLGVAGEVAWRVPSLRVPDLRALPSADRLGEYESVRLFAERAAAVRPGFAVTGSNALAIAQICQRLDGIPLAIELAAARVAVLSPEQIALRLRDRFRLLAGGSRTALRRQQTLRAAVDWSHDLLSEAERAVLRRLSVFAGGFGIDAAEAVCAGPPVESPEVLDLLGQLVAKSLVLAEAQGEEVRYHLLETIRQYNQEKLEDAEEAEVVRDRHRDWYLPLAERAHPKLAGPEQGVWADQLELEHDNLRTALDWSLESDAEAAVRLAGSLYRFWRVRGYLEEGRRSLALALEEAGESSSVGGRAARARALRAAGLLAVDQVDHLGAIRWFEAALALYRELGDQAGIVRTLPDLGTCVLFGMGDQDRARDLLQESLRLSRLAEDRRGEGIVLLFLCMVSMVRDESVEAMRFGEESVTLLREARDDFNTSISLRLLGQATLRRGDVPRARRWFSEGLRLARELGDRRAMGIDELCLAAAAVAEGDLGQARDLVRESVNLLLDTGTTLVHYALEFLGFLELRKGDLHRGVRLYAAGTDGRSSVSSPPFRFYTPSRAEMEVDLARARATLGEEAFARVWAEGQAMTLEQAVEYALA